MSDPGDECSCKDCRPKLTLVTGELLAFARPIATYGDALDEGEAWGAFYRGEGPKPTIDDSPPAA